MSTARWRTDTLPELGRPSIVLAECDDGLYLVAIAKREGNDDDDDDELAGRQPGGHVPERTRPLELVPSWAAGQLVDIDAVGSTVVLLLGRRPPLMVSHDRGQTWSERGGGLPRGHALALGENPDHFLYGARNRLYVSGDGGRFWRALAVELPEIRDVAWG